LTACNSPDSDSTNTATAVTGVTLNQSSLTLAVNGTAVLTPTVEPNNATNKNVSWSSSNPGVATVNNGTVTAVSAGSATISVTTADGGFFDTCDVTVEPADPNTVAVTDVTLNESILTLEIDDTATLIATVNPSNATNKDVTWSSSNNNVATVDGGTVTAIAEGTATITVTTADGGFFDTCDVTVEPADPNNVAVIDVTLNESILTLEIDDTATLNATINPSNATNKNVTWSSDNTNVATVVDGTVTAIAEGTATITVTTADGGKTATCVVTVNPVTGDASITINFDGPAEDIVLAKDDTAFTFSVADTAYSNFRWILNGVEQSENSSSITFNQTELADGPHRLTVIASKAGIVYSQELNFLVSE
jgi:uncharacterized protein YjdB